MATPRIIQCKYCKKEFRPIKRTRIYCSRECFNKSLYSKKKKICKHCGSEFLVHNYRFKNALYCSKKCCDKDKIGFIPKRALEYYNAHRKELTCPQCRKKFIVPLWRIKEGRRFCSRECATLELKKRTKESNPCWKGNNCSKNTARMRAKKWFKLKPCEICNSFQIIHRHHIDGNPFNNEPNNIKFLCPKHHKEFHLKKAKFS